MASIGIAELAAAPCSELTEQMTVEFTAAHSNLGAVGVSLEGPGGPYAFDLSPTAPQDPGESWFGTATPAMGGRSKGSLRRARTCSRSVRVLLTTGDRVPTRALVDYIAFCKGSS